MDEKTYKELVDKLPSELRMKLEQIKMFLSQGKASVMVGAGFSKNAQQMEFATMKDWKELTKAFYDQLFVGESNSKEEYLYESLKLAQMYECSFGRNALDALIQSALPNETTTPGKLHHELMQLNWKDVFTTNYDTLLERAALGTDRTYQVVTNKETLLYANSPRIIKLHGSFPNIRPYIITEEDFRTYPQKYPEFVNTVRQALMESLFCLIGFSGDDPNFLQWMGWLRDVMGNQMSPAYLITYEPHLHKSQIDLFKGRGIEIINMATIKDGISYSEGLEFVMKFLSKESTKRWSPYIEFGKIDKKEDVEAATKKMQSVRKSYPHYLYLPKEYHDDFEQSLIRYNINTSVLEQLSQSQKIQFIYETIWRYEVSMTPILVPWLLEEIDSLAFSEEDCDKKDIWSLNEIRLTMLSLLRIWGLPTHYDKLTEILFKQALTKEQNHRFIYEQCIHELGLLEYDKVDELLQIWDVDGTDIRSALWKSVALSEIGKDNEAINLLNSTNQRFRQSLLTQGENRQVMATYSNAMEEVMKLLESQSIIDTSLVDLKNYLIRKITEAENKPSKVYESIHKFGIDQEQTTWHSDTNKPTLVLYGYKYLRLTELVGYPLGHSKFPINETWLQTSIQAIWGQFDDYALQVLVRSRSKSATLGVLNRKNVLTIQSDWADRQYELYKTKIDDYIASSTFGAFGVKVSNVLFPAFARIAPRLSMHNVENLGNQYIACYNKRKVGYDSSFLADIQRCMSAPCKIKHNKQLFSAEAEDDGMQLVWTGDWMPQTSIDEKDVDSMVATLAQFKDSEDKRVFIRLWYMMNSKLTEGQRAKLETAVRDWRNKDHPRVLIFYILMTYKLVDYDTEVDRSDFSGYLKQVLDTIHERDVEKIRSTEVINKLRTAITLLIDYVPYLSEYQHEIVLSKICQLLKNNEDILKKDDSESFLGGLRGSLQQLIVQFTRYVAKSDFTDVRHDLLEELEDICLRYTEYKVATIAIVVILDNYNRKIADIALIEHVKNALIKGSYLEYVEGLQSISHTEVFSIRHELTKFIVDYASYSINKRTKHFVSAITGLIEDGKIGRRWTRRTCELLNRIADSVSDFEGDEEMRMDLMYFTNMLAGAVSATWGESEETKRWKAITQDNANFNDVRVGYDLGQAGVIDAEEVMSRIVFVS